MITNGFIPLLRRDLSLEQITHEGKNFIILTDMIGFAEVPIAISTEFFVLLQSIPENTTKTDMMNMFGVDDINLIQPILNEIENLDKLFFLESDSYKIKRKKFEEEFLSNPVREPICVNGSYPANPDEFNAYFKDFFETVDKNEIDTGAKALIVPHIDFRLGRLSHEVYASGYHAIRDTGADLFVIFGTSHYASTDVFMLSEKHFNTPIGLVENDIEIINELKESCPETFTIDEFAHKPEHSIELQTILLKYYFQNKNFKIIPILVGSFFEFIEQKKSPKDFERFRLFLEGLNQTIEKLGRKAVYIASVDFSHIGRKFGDDFDAETKLHEVNNSDSILIDYLEKSDSEAFFNKIMTDCDKWKVCGTSPIYSMLNLKNFSKGKFLKYNQWNETATKSAVTFASIAYYE
jgi:AmmeMemoRadiSam system protein B